LPPVYIAKGREKTVRAASAMIEAADNPLLPRRRALVIDGLPPLALALLLAIVAISAAGGAAGLAFETSVRPSSLFLFVALAVPAALTQLFAIRKPRHQVFHAALVFVIAGALLLPTPLLVLMCVVQHIPDWMRHRYRWYIQTFNIANYVVSALAAAWAARGASGSSLLVVSGFAATVTFLIVNRVLLAAMLHAAHRLSPRQTGLFTLEDVWIDFSLSAMGVSLAALGGVELWIVPLALAPLMLIYYLQRGARELEQASETIQRQNVSLQEANELMREQSRAAMEGLAATVDARDAYTAGHSRRVRHISLAIGAELGLPAGDLEVLAQAALLHDIGKIAIPDVILLKPGRLTAEEWRVMQTHAQEGAQIIERLGFLDAAVPVIRHHHERLDGSGYPQRLRGDEVPLLAQIVGICDVYDALTSHRPYRPALSAEEAARHLVKESAQGKFNREHVDAFLSVVGMGAVAAL
jgi:putative nucleotidyltransferase with HDIG domain